MIIEELKYFTLSERLPTSIKNSRTVYLNRRRVLLKGFTDKGVYWGEASPLEFFSKESVNDIKIALGSSFNKLEVQTPTKENIVSLLNHFEKLPSLKFAIEQILVSALLDNKTTVEFLPSEINGTIKTSALIPTTLKEDFFKLFYSLVNQGIKRVKIKIGLDNFTQDVNLIKQLNKICEQKEVLLRLDVNGKWSLQEATKRLKAFAGLPIEYVEQPVSNIDEIIALAEESPIPIAADESIYDLSNIQKLLESRVQYFVVKPMILGGLFETLNLNKKIKSGNKRLILSSAFEGPIGFSYLLLISSVLNNNEYHGLPFSLGKNNTEFFPFKFQQGNIYFTLNNYFHLQKNFAVSNA